MLPNPELPLYMLKSLVPGDAEVVELYIETLLGVIQRLQADKNELLEHIRPQISKNAKSVLRGMALDAREEEDHLTAGALTFLLDRQTLASRLTEKFTPTKAPA